MSAVWLYWSLTSNKSLSLDHEAGNGKYFDSHVTFYWLLLDHTISTIVNKLLQIVYHIVCILYTLLKISPFPERKDISTWIKLRYFLSNDILFLEEEQTVFNKIYFLGNKGITDPKDEKEIQKMMAEIDSVRFQF